MFDVEQTGSFKRTLSWLHVLQRLDMRRILDKYAKQGVEALSDATPRETGLTAESWNYKIDIGKNRITVTWYNTNENKGVPIALILQYGHGTGTGGYVQGIDYINPAMRPIFDSMSEAIFKEVFSE